MYVDEQNYDGAIDLPELMARVEYDHELLGEIFEVFIEEFPRLSEELRASMEVGDWRKVQVAAHSLKGMLSSLSFPMATASALKIERMVKEARPEGIREEFARLEQKVALAGRKLETVCREVGR